MILSGSQARRGRTSVGIVGVEHVRGDLAPKVVAGRLPVGPDEVALGRVTARQLDAHVGDRMELVGPGGKSAYRVVGVAVVPTLGAIDGAGVGAVTTSDGLARLDSAPSYNLAAVVLKPGVPRSVANDIAGRFGEPTAGRESPPSSIVNVARVRRIPVLLAGLLVVLALVTLVHSLLVSINGRRRDLAVLRALGADGGWIGRAVHSQATVLTIAPLARRHPARAAGRLDHLPGLRRPHRRAAGPRHPRPPHRRPVRRARARRQRGLRRAGPPGPLHLDVAAAARGVIGTRPRALQPVGLVRSRRAAGSWPK